ncbi:MAG: hypothetical protein JW822_14415 [Spirochaetales bacterium]|nr:hypothetical protein [Spirochaetales bacterium]
MKKLLLLGVGILVISIMACSGGNQIAISDKMNDFLSTLSDTNSIIAAAEKYGYSPENVPLGIYELKEPIVTKVEKQGQQTLYFVNVTHGEIKDDIIVVWDGDVVVDVRDYKAAE